MPRTVDSQRHAQRREAILEEAHRQFASRGFDRATTASICRGAGISSGTFFHYFPTKMDALIGVLTSGVDHTGRQLQRIERAGGGLRAVLAYAEHLETEITDPHFAGFVRALAGVEQLPRVAEVLREESTMISGFLNRQLVQALSHQEIRDDLEVEQVVRWVQWLLDGAAQGATVSPARPGDVVAALQGLLVRRRSMGAEPQDG